jgi:DNA-binding beta-propeller fold protein YncE
MRTMRLAALLLAWLACVSLAHAQWPPNPGFPNVAQTPGALLSGPLAPNQGRTAILAYHNGVLFSVPEIPASEPGSDFQVRIWNITNPAAPSGITQLGGPTLGITPQPVMAHGYFYVIRPSGAYLVIGADFCGQGCPWSFRANAGVPGLVREASGATSYGVRGDLFQPWFVTPSYWSYNAIETTPAEIYRGEPFRPADRLGQFDHLGATGVIGHPFLLGNILYYVSDQSRTGIAAYDIGNPAAPVLLDVLTTGGPGGYWPELWAGEGRLLAVMPYNNNGNGMRVADLTDPTNLRFLDDVPLPGDVAMYAQFQDEFGFIGQHKIDMRTFRSVLEFEPPNGTTLDVSQFALPLGNLLVTGGVGEGQGMAIWAHQAAPDTRPPSVAYHVPGAGQANYPAGAPISVLIHETLDLTTLAVGTSFRVRVVSGGVAGGAPLAGSLTVAFDDVLTFTPDAPLAANTTYEVRLEDLRDAAGNAMTEAYAFTFSTGASVGGNLPPEVTLFTAAPYPVAPNADAAFDAAATDPNPGDTLQFRFDFGDGTPKTAWGAASSTTHAYAAPGHYRATVQVRDGSNVVASRNAVVTVLAPTGAAPGQSSSLACHAPSRRVFAVNPDADTLAEVDADTLAVVREITVCDDPRGVARSAQGELWVTCFDADAIAIVNATTGAVTQTLPTGYGSAPHGVAMSPDGETAYVSLHGAGALRRYATATRTQTAQLALGPGPRAIAVSADHGRVLVTRFLSPANFAEVWDVNPAGAMSLTRAIRINKFGDDANRDTPAAGKGVANQLAGIAFGPLDGLAWLAAQKPNNERGRLILPSIDLDSDNTVRNLALALDPAQGTDTQRLRRAVDLDNSDSASAVAFAPLGDYVLVTLQGNDELLVLDALETGETAGLGSFVSRLAVGAAPQGACVDATTRRTFVQNLMGRSVTALETDALFRLGTVAVGSTAIDTVAAEPLAPAVLAGKTIFYNASDPRMSPEGYISCATCHLDGGHDGRTWDFTGRGEGLRNTPTLQGRGGTAHGNVHWSANFDEIQDFEGDIRSFFGGAGFMSDASYAATSAPLGAPKAGLSAPLDALAAYVASLGSATVPRSPHRNADGSMTAQATAGMAVFASLGCASCHAPPRYTDSALGAGTLRDVGTLRETSGGRLGGALTGIDTPTLLGLWQTAPYFHDGSAATLDDVFRVVGGTRIPGENGTPSGGAQILTLANFVDLNNDDTPRGEAYAQLEEGDRITFTNVDGGPGGLGAIELRYSNSPFRLDVAVIVNGGVPRLLALPDVGNTPAFRSTHWATARLEDVPLNPGATNTVALEAASWYVAVDEIVVSHAGHRAAGAAHRAVLAASAADQAALRAFLLELDRPLEPPSEALFANGFEQP